jgi:opacity protein-like surface antigen
MKNQIVTAFLSVALAALAAPAVAQERSPDGVAVSPFYGGVALRDRGADGPGVSFGSFTSAWNKFSSSTTDDSAVRALIFGGYRWRNDLSVEAAYSRSDSYALRPAGTSARSGVGLALPDSFDSSARAWNVDVYGSYRFYKTFALYGRLGYVQAEGAQSLPSLAGSDARRTRDGVNYGVGVRYDMTPVLGLKVEYARFGRLASESFAVPEVDQVQFGVQYRF